ncbi:MAG: hypothetical protein QM715_16400 [Nibricoccus sp.]
MKLRDSHWAVYFIVWLLAVVGGGALVGAVSFPLLGPLFGSDHSVFSHVVAGARHLGFIALVWAPGIALVACVIRAKQNKSRQ